MLFAFSSDRETGIAVKSAIEIPSTCTAKLSGRSRFPWHAGHSVADMCSISQSRYVSDPDSSIAFFKYPNTPRNPVLPALLRLSVKQQVLDFLRQLFKRRAQINPISRAHDLHLTNQIRRRRPRPQPALQQRLRPVVDHLRGIKIVLAAQPMALRTRPIRAIKRKRPRLQLRHVNPAIRTRQPLRIKLLFAAHNRHLHQSARQLHRQPDRHLQPVLNPRPSPAAGPPPLRWCDSCACPVRSRLPG